MGRKEVLVPGHLLPSPQPGKFHGVITATKFSEESGQNLATVALSDVKKVKLSIPWSEVQQYLLQKPEGPATKKARRQAPPIGMASGSQFAGHPAVKRVQTADPAEVLGSSLLRDDGILVQEPPAPEKVKPPPDPKRYGELLQSRIAAMSSVASARWPLGTKLWVKQRGNSAWPVLMWTAQICRKRDIGQLLAAYRPGMLLVRCYGEHSSMWVKEADLEEFSMEDSSRFHTLRAWGRQHSKSRLVDTVIEEIENALEDADGEVERLLEIEKQSLAGANLSLECSQCQEEGATAACLECERIFHTLCMQPPALKATDLPDSMWSCPFCGHTNQVGEGCTEEEKELTVERMGLTPDWIIQAAAFDVFQLDQPNLERPYIKGLLDPCTNSMAAPNIPAEVLYDKQMNGLKLSNSWAGYLILLNPPYTAATQWRFVNRAIDEVENDQVPAVLLLCRNSTDTAYFQRLRPYPRVLLRRTNTRFKDYSKTPIGFGICVFAIAKSSCRELYSRFYEAFADMGEPNIPIDKSIMRTDEFHDLLERLRQHAEEHYRDHWIQCSTCGKWRIITYQSMLAAKDADWTCRQLRPPFTSCRTPQTKREVLGGRYAVLGAEGDLLGMVAEKVDYSIPRLDLPLPKQPGPRPAATESGSPVAQAALGSAASSVAVVRFVKLPTRPFNTRTTQDAPQVLTAIELARQARIAANRAYLAGLRLGPSAMASGEVTAVPAQNALVLAAARQLAEKAALAEARSQVDQAKRHWAKTSVVCEKETARLQAAMLANAEDLRSARAYLGDAKEALESMLAEQAAKHPPASPCAAPPPRSSTGAASSSSHGDGWQGAQGSSMQRQHPLPDPPMVIAPIMAVGVRPATASTCSQGPACGAASCSPASHLPGRSAVPWSPNMAFSSPAPPAIRAAVRSIDTVHSGAAVLAGLPPPAFLCTPTAAAMPNPGCPAGGEMQLAKSFWQPSGPTNLQPAWLLQQIAAQSGPNANLAAVSSVYFGVMGQGPQQATGSGAPTGSPAGRAMPGEGAAASVAALGGRTVGLASLVNVAMQKRNNEGD